MADSVLTIRWHSRAGQGAITAARALAEILGAQGKFVQSFPEFGAEKRGAPVTVFNRISNQPLIDVSKPTTVDLVILLDPTLVASCEVDPREVLVGLKKDGQLLANTKQTEFAFARSVKLATLDASNVAVAEIGRDIPNVPILGALVRIIKLVSLTAFQAELKNYLGHGLPEKIVAGNLKAFERGYNEVKI